MLNTDLVNKEKQDKAKKFYSSGTKTSCNALKNSVLFKRRKQEVKEGGGHFGEKFRDGVEEEKNALRVVKLAELVPTVGYTCQRWSKTEGTNSKLQTVTLFRPIRSLQCS